MKNIANVVGFFGALVAASPLLPREACEPQPAGHGPVPSPDSPSAFVALSAFSTAANNAPTPAGYHKTFTDLKASCNSYGYLGYTALESYDTNACATRCEATQGCAGFNIYFERDPTVDPGNGCPNPPSTTVIKCAFWTGDVSAALAVNKGQYRDQFQVVIAGSNGYMKSDIPFVPGYTGTYLGNAAINAPLCNGKDTYMGFKQFTTNILDPALCAAACNSQNEYNLAHPPATGEPMICRFFNVYMLDKNGSRQGQICAMYTTKWDNSYATNKVSILFDLCLPCHDADFLRGITPATITLPSVIATFLRTPTTPSIVKLL